MFCFYNTTSIFHILRGRGGRFWRHILPRDLTISFLKHYGLLRKPQYQLSVYKTFFHKLLFAGTGTSLCIVLFFPRPRQNFSLNFLLGNSPVTLDTFIPLKSSSSLVLGSQLQSLCHWDHISSICIHNFFLYEQSSWSYYKPLRHLLWWYE